MSRNLGFLRLPVITKAVSGLACKKKDDVNESRRSNSGNKQVKKKENQREREIITKRMKETKRKSETTVLIENTTENCRNRQGSRWAIVAEAQGYGSSASSEIFFRIHTAIIPPSLTATAKDLYINIAIVATSPVSNS